MFPGCVVSCPFTVVCLCARSGFVFFDVWLSHLDFSMASEIIG